MCGRTACTLDKQGVQRATCRYSNNKEPLKWVEKYEWQNYQPNYNLSPTQVSPVLVSDTVIASLEKCEDYAIMPMRWGLIPSWYKGKMQEFSLSTNNCRWESILEKPTFKKPITAGQRCVVLADGFYEWKAVKTGKKQPYFIYFPQEEGFDAFTESTHLWNKDEDWAGPRLLTMAGIFDTWKKSETEVMYSYSVVTLDSSKAVSFIHTRMPAILDGEDQVKMWLDVNRVSAKEAVANLKPIENLQVHPVSTEVNSSRNNSLNCILPLKEEPETKATPKPTALTSWLQKAKTEDSPSKRPKTE